MIAGLVLSSREIIVPLTLRCADGEKLAMEAQLDTGFSEFLCLPQACVDALDLRLRTTETLVLGDESEIRVSLYECTVRWGEQELVVDAHCTGDAPIIGMSLLWDHFLTMQVTEGGPVAIWPVAEDAG